MKSITIHKLDDELVEIIEQLAYSKGLSQNKVIKDLLRKAVGLDKKNHPKRDLTPFFGAWSTEETLDFSDNVKAFDEIDNELWN